MDLLAPHACFVLAAWIEFNRRRRAAGNPPTDAFLSAMEADLPDPALQADEYASKFLELTRVISPEIGQNKAVLAAVTARYYASPSHQWL